MTKKKILLIAVAFIIAITGYLFEGNKELLPGKNDNEIRVHFIDVGQGDCIFVELNDNKTMLIDAGNPENGSDISSYIKRLGVEKIDFIFATHPHSDHIGGLSKVIYDFDIGNIYMPSVTHNTDLFYNLLKTIENKGKTAETVKGRKVIYSSDDGIMIEILSPKRNKYNNLNNYSIVVKLTYLNNSFLFTGDIEKEVETALLKDNIDCDVLKVAHHGSSSSSSKKFIKLASPEYAVISCGKENDYGHPHKETILNLIDSKILRTDKMGTIVITSDGFEIKSINLDETKEELEVPTNKS